MKKIIFLLFFLPVIAVSQSWYPVGATWYFNYEDGVAFNAIGYTKYTVVKDTVVNLLPSKLIQKEVMRFDSVQLSNSTLIVREENSRVYYYENNTFNLMYDLNLNVGDTLKISISISNCDSVSPLIVDSIRNLNINGTNLKVQYVKSINYYGSAWQGYIDSITYKIIERVGNDQMCTNCTNFLFKPFCQVGEALQWTGLRCYIDNDITYKSYQWTHFYPNLSCDALLYGIGITENLKDGFKIDIYPNPFKDNLTIETNNTNKEQRLEIVNPIGQTVYTSYIYSKATINTSAFAKGVYILKLYTDKETVVRKFVKE